VQANICGCGLSDSVSLSQRCTSVLHAPSPIFTPTGCGVHARDAERVSRCDCEVWLMTWILASLKPACSYLGFVIHVYILVP
jgi:hypothetical protein